MSEIFERYAKEQGIKILRIKKRNPFVRFFSIDHYNVTFRYGKKILRGNFWAGVNDPDIDCIYWSIMEALKKDNLSEFEIRVLEINNARRGGF